MKRINGKMREGQLILSLATATGGVLPKSDRHFPIRCSTSSWFWQHLQSVSARVAGMAAANRSEHWHTEGLPISAFSESPYYQANSLSESTNKLCPFPMLLISARADSEDFEGFSLVLHGWFNWQSQIKGRGSDDSIAVHIEISQCDLAYKA